MITSSQIIKISPAKRKYLNQQINRQIRTSQIYFKVRVKFLDGKQRWYWLPKDLQVGMREHYHNQHIDLQNYTNHQLINDDSGLLGALIVVPIEKYTKGKTPMMNLGQVQTLVFTKGKNKRLWNTRSQFVPTTEIDGQLEVKNNFENALEFLRHDYPEKIQQEIEKQFREWIPREKGAYQAANVILLGGAIAIVIICYIIFAAMYGGL